MLHARGRLTEAEVFNAMLIQDSLPDARGTSTSALVDA